MHRQLPVHFFIFGSKNYLYDASGVWELLAWNPQWRYSRDPIGKQLGEGQKNSHHGGNGKNERENLL